MYRKIFLSYTRLSVREQGEDGSVGNGMVEAFLWRDVRLSANPAAGHNTIVPKQFAATVPN
jgi:hypothetical protein